MNFERFFILGPTAVGKSSLSVEWAQKYKGCVVNADSLQFFKDLKIGTAYPEEEDFKKAPHYLFGLCALEEDFSAGEFVRRYHKFEDDLLLKGSNLGQSLDRFGNEDAKNFENSGVQPIFIVGGSGFYLKALETGMFDVSQDSLDSDLPTEHLTWSQEKQIKFLQKHDPDYLLKIGEKDHYRRERAIQLILAENKGPSELHQASKEEQKEKPEAFALKLGLYLEKEELLKRVQERTKKMLEKGLVEEARELQAKVSSSWKPLSSVGYKEVLAYLNGEIENLDLLEEAIIKNTMGLVKKQMTWFRADPEIVWFHAAKEADKASLWLEESLEKPEDDLT